MFPQTPTQRPKTGEQDVVKISTNLIQVDATVLDKNGKIVTGLTADDFEIYENNKKQQITNFSFVAVEPDKAAEALTLKPAKKSIPLPPVPGNLHPEQVHRTVALVVDDLGLSLGSMNAVKSALKKFVDEQMQPGDLVAIIRTGSGAGTLQRFTSDKRMLYAAIEHVRLNARGRGGINVFQPVDPSGADVGYKFREDIFTVGTLGAINYVIKGMRELPGRKAVLLFSDGFGLYDDDNGIKKPNPRLTDNLQHLTELANRSSVVIYTIDTRGLVVPMVDSQDSFENFIKKSNSSSNQRTSVVEQLGLDRSTELYETQQGLKALAEQTGGFAVINKNDLGKGIERVLNDQKGYYLLGYRPDSETFDPKKARFHKLTVRLKRPDLRVRYRSGFFSIRDEETKPAVKTPRQQILAALTSPFTSGDIDLRLTSLFADDAQTGAFMRSLLYVNGRDLKFTEEADGWQKATFEIVAMTFGDNGEIVDEVSRTETVRARADTLREIREKGFVSTITVPIKKPGAYQMRVVMRDAATSRIGSASQFIEVPNLNKDHLTLSGILLQRVQSQSNGDQTATGQKEFQSDEQRDIATRTFRAGMNVRFGYGIYNAKIDKATNSSKLTMQFKVFHDGKELFASNEKDVKLVEGTDPQRLFAEGMFTLGKMIQPGDYVLQLIVRDSLRKGIDQIATQWIDFEVVE
jgi:VWFA-related protein